MLALRAMRALGHDAREAGVIADHLIDCELRGVHYGGLPRALSIAERVARTAEPPRPLLVIVAIRPDLLTPGDEFKTGVAAFAASVRRARSIDGAAPVRMPFDRSREERRRRLREDRINVSNAVYSDLTAIVSGVDP